ncbi:MAG: ATP-binding protein [Chlorobi bacterium]|nr:ATP-binding protein [Chlorobiota bacterium]
MENHPVLKLIEEGEHQRLDFKFAVNDSRKIARSLSAFANTEGGRLLIGVKDNGKIAGVRSNEEFYMLQAASELYTEPKVPFEVKTHLIGGREVMEVVIEKSELRPHKAPDEKGRMRAFVRVKDENLLANGLLLRVWEKEKSGNGVEISYGKAESFLLRYLNEYPYITFSKFRKSSGISFKKAESVLVDFILSGIIKIDISSNFICYRLSDSD